MSNLIERRNRIREAVPHIATASGSIASFQTDMRSPIEEIKIHFNPLQSGTGTPSPTNVRPITGWTGCDVHDDGKNLFDQTTMSDVDAYTNILGSYYYTVPIYLKPNTTYRIWPSEEKNLGVSTYYVIYINPSADDPTYLVSINSAFNYPVYAGSSRAIVFTTGATGTIRFGIPTTYRPTNLSAFMSVNWQLEVGSYASTYKPYVQGTKIPVSWSALGTVYGGLVNEDGEVWAEWVNIASYNGETLPGEWKSDRDVYAAGTTPTIGAQVVYKLSTPVLVGTISPISLKTLVGTNNIWASANGNVDVKYWKH